MTTYADEDEFITDPIVDTLTTQQLFEEAEWRRCAPQRRGKRDPSSSECLVGFLYFCENYWHIKHPERGRIKFEMFEAQTDTSRVWLTDRYSLVLKARQIGFSTLCAAFTFWNGFFYPDRPILMLSRTEREAIKLLGKSKYGYQFLPEWMKWRGGPVRETQTKFEFTNGSYIESLPSASDPARGESAYLVVVDELAFLPNSEEAWGAIEPVADVGGRVIMLSTANGEGNLFHRLWMEAVVGANRFSNPLFFPWSANGRDLDWYEGKKRDLPEWQMAQEYPDNPEDAFLKSGRPVFNLDALRSIETSPPVAEGYINERGLFVEDGGALKIWAFPEEKGRYAIGADPSQGLEHGDFASVHVINARTVEVVAAWHGHIDPDLLGTEVLARLGKFYNKALAGVESNNHGLTTLKALQKDKYHPIYQQRSAAYRKAVQTDLLGFRTTQVTKPLMIDELNEVIRTGAMALHDELTIAELRTFTRDERGKMSGSPFDDRTISLAIANQMLKYVWLEQYQPKEEPGPGTWAHLQTKLYGTDLDALTRGRKTGRMQAPRRPIGGNYARST